MSKTTHQSDVLVIPNNWLDRDAPVRLVTICIEEDDQEVTFDLFGEKRTMKVVPIEEMCKTCDWAIQYYNGNIFKCREKQAKDAKERGFSKVICPEQFKEKDENT